MLLCACSLILVSNLMEALGYYQADITGVYLGDLELALAMSISTIFWRGQCDIGMVFEFIIRHAETECIAAVKAVNNQTVPDQMTPPEDDSDDNFKYSLQVGVI